MDGKGVSRGKARWSGDAAQYVMPIDVLVPPRDANGKLRNPLSGVVEGANEMMDATDLQVLAIGAALADLETAFAEAGWNNIRSTLQLLVETAGVKHGYDQVAVIGDECQTVIVDRPDNS